jgi:hypothetical protein
VSTTTKMAWAIGEYVWERAQLRARISDVCADIDVWRDEWPGATLRAVVDRLGDLNEVLVTELQSEYDRLLKQASRHGLTDEEAGI